MKSQYLIAILFALTSAPAFAQVVATNPGCVLPGFEADEAAVIDACSDLLRRTDLSTAPSVEAIIIRGRASKMLGRLADAMADFDRALELAPDSPEPYLRRGWVAYDYKDFEKAIGLVDQALKLDPQRAETFDLLGVLAFVMGRQKLAIESYDKAVNLNPDAVMPRYHRFEYYAATRRFREALAEARSILETKSPDLDQAHTRIDGVRIKYRTLTRIGIAELLERQGQFEAAEKFIDEFIEAEPGEFSYSTRANYRYSRGTPEETRADAEKAISYSSSYWRPYGTLGATFLHLKDYVPAVDALTMAITLYPQAGGNYWYRAMALRAMKRPDEALKDAKAAVSVDAYTRNRKITMLSKLGYLVPVEDPDQLNNALNVALEACMADESCW